MNRREFISTLGAAAAVPILDQPTLEEEALRYFTTRLEESIRTDQRSSSEPIRLLDFVAQSWPIIEPKTPFQSNWHLGAICEHLEAISLGQLGNTLINIPPGCSKSIVVSVGWNAWEWTRWPDHRWLCGSYDQQLSTRDNRRVRDILASDFYQQRWPLKLRSDQNQKTQYENEYGGWRIGTSVSGLGTGHHPHRKVIDDPHNVKKSLSAVQRQEAITWLDLTMATRGAALNAVTVVIMQRLHEGDLSGHILETLRDRYTVIVLPMRYEPPAWVEIEGKKRLVPRMEKTPLGFQDPRTTPGELLWPGLFDEAKVRSIEASLRASHGEFGVAGQLQQRPVPQGGGLIKREWFEIVDAIPSDEVIVARTRGWDCAATEGGGDWTVGVRLAYAKSGKVYIEHVLRGQWGPARFEGPAGIFKQTAQSDGRGVRIREEQEPGSAGKKVIQAHALLLTGFDYKGEPSSGDKVTRNAPFRASAAQKNVKLLRGDWNQAYLSVLCSFPGTHDDDVDATTVAFNDATLSNLGTVQVVKTIGH
jgi:predicted phage terminase large subunit-like protein